MNSDKTTQTEPGIASNAEISKKALRALFREAWFRCSETELPKSFYIVTACEPNAEKTEPSRNEALNLQLRGELQERGARFFPVTGGDQAFEHAEPSYAIECDRDLAVELGTRFQQKAIFSVIHGEISLIWTDGSDDPDEHLAQWDERVV